jgi:hypothetical protein
MADMERFSTVITLDPFSQSLDTQRLACKCDNEGRVLAVDAARGETDLAGKNSVTGPKSPPTALPHRSARLAFMVISQAFIKR